MATRTINKYYVRRVFRTESFTDTPVPSHQSFAVRLENALNDFASLDYEIVDLCIGNKDAIIVAKCEWLEEDE